MALTPADRLSNSRIEATDPYVAVLFLGLVFGVLLVSTRVSLLRRARMLDQT